MSLTVGSLAPDFTLFSGKGQTVTLSDLRGQRVVLVFFPAAFTGVCTKEMCSFQSALAQFNDLNATVLGISVDGVFANQAFRDQNGLEFTVLSDFQREAVTAYGIAVENFAGFTGYTAANRAVFVIDGQGKLAYVWVAPSLGQEPDYSEVQAAVALA